MCTFFRRIGAAVICVGYGLWQGSTLAAERIQTGAIHSTTLADVLLGMFVFWLVGVLLYWDDPT